MSPLPFALIAESSGSELLVPETVQLGRVVAALDLGRAGAHLSLNDLVRSVHARLSQPQVLREKTGHHIHVYILTHMGLNSCQSHIEAYLRYMIP